MSLDSADGELFDVGVLDDDGIGDDVSQIPESGTTDDAESWSERHLGLDEVGDSFSILIGAHCSVGATVELRSVAVIYWCLICGPINHTLHSSYQRQTPEWQIKLCLSRCQINCKWKLSWTADQNLKA